MKKEELTIKIPQPCSEKWDEMTPADRGRYCASCQKTVIDFSTMTDSEVINIFKAAKDGSPCGRFHHSQLDRELIPAKRIGSFSFALLKRIAASLLFFQSLVTTAWAQTVKPKTHQQAKPKSDLRTYVTAHGIKGCVTDYVTNAPLCGMLVQIEGTDIKAITGLSGTYFLPVPDSFSKAKVKLVVSYTEESGTWPEGTLIPDEEFAVDESLFKSDIVLYRYPVDLQKTVVTKAYIMPMIDHSYGITITPVYRNRIDESPGGISVFRAVGNLFRKKR